MAGVKFNIKINNSKCKAIEKAAEDALFLTAEAIHTDVVQSQVMPFDTGTMQNESTYVEKITSKKVSLVTKTPYAARLYYHPEYNFRKTNNANARGRWLDDYLIGSKWQWVKDTYAWLFRSRYKG